MSGKIDKTPTSYANPAFDEEPAGAGHNGGPSPTGSNIFIVKPDSGKANRSHLEPHRHDPVTKNNIGQNVLRGIRCEYSFFIKYQSLSNF
jgi:hypothetical protein